MSKVNSSRSLPAGQLREAVAERVAATSLRNVAREVGVSASGLQYFLRGGVPYTATRRKLEGWYVREAAPGYGDIPPEAVLGTLRSLVQTLPPVARPGAVGELVTALERAFATRRVAPPSWLVKLHEAAPADADQGERRPGRAP